MKEINLKWCWRGDLRSGTYQIVPFSTGCKLKYINFGDDRGVKLYHKDENDEVQLTRSFQSVIYFLMIIV